MDTINLNRINVILDEPTIEILKRLGRYNNTSLSSVCAHLIKRQIEDEEELFNIRIRETAFVDMSKTYGNS